jgi:5-methylcytosine-specific restriction protein A
MRWDTQMSGVRIPDEVAEELEKIWQGFKIKSDLLLPEEINEGEALFEGAKQQIIVNAYERNPEARRKCIAHYGTSCSICGFNFLETYGEEGRDLIHIHHLRQLAEIGDEYQIDPINDLRPVCPNCHAMLHNRKPTFSLE